MLKLAEPTAGSIAFDGAALARPRTASGLRGFRRQAQLVFQNPFDALNPRFTIYRAVAEPLLNAGIDQAEHADRVAAAFRRVHLPDLDRYLDKYPHQLSGGQLQRVVLARALVLAPRFLVADEPVSMLDVSVRAGILALMREVRDDHGADRRLYLPRPRAGPLPLRAHGGDVSRHAWSRTGRPSEIVRSRAIPTPAPWSPPCRFPTPTSRALRCRSAATSPMPASRPRAAASATAAPLRRAICAEQDPPLREVGPGRRSACHFS